MLAAAITTGALLIGGCAATPEPGEPPAGSTEDRSEPTNRPEGEPSEAPADDPDAATSWGPTVGEWEEAQVLVADWAPARLAGQVIVGRYRGTDPDEAATMVRDLHLAGMSMTGDNVVDEAQVRAMTTALQAAGRADGRSFPPVIGVDQEGGYVSHLRGVATEFPHFASAGLAIQADPRTGRQVTRQAAYATAMELRDLGFTWVFAPVADVTIGAADPTIGARSPSQDPLVASAATGAAVRGYDAAGLVSTTKHFPGHGSATSDSHDTLPLLDLTTDDLRTRDLLPFEAAVRASAPAIMMAHLDLTQVAPGVPSSLAPEVYDLLRDDVGFEGVAITDSLGMGGVGGIPKPAVQALVAGADLLLMPVDTPTTHRLVTEAIRSGEVSRERVEQAAARVVAVQMWQQRVSDEVPVPADATEQAAAASAALLAAAY